MALRTDVLRASFAAVVEREPELTRRFYEILFSRYPAVRPMFPAGAGLARQQEMLQGALVAVLEHLDDAPWLTTQLRALGAKHVEYGVEDGMYPWVGECLVAALKEAASDAWTPRIEQAWLGAFAAISELMLSGAAKARSSAI